MKTPSTANISRPNKKQRTNLTTTETKLMQLPNDLWFQAITYLESDDKSLSFLKQTSKLLKERTDEVMKRVDAKYINKTDTTVISPKLVVLGDTSATAGERSIHLLKSKNKTYEVCLFKPQQSPDVEIGVFLFILTLQYNTDNNTNGCIIYCDMTDNNSIEDLKKNITWAKAEKKRIDDFHMPKEGNLNYFITIIGISPEGKLPVITQAQLNDLAKENGLNAPIFQVKDQATLNVLGEIIKQNYNETEAVKPMHSQPDSLKGKTTKLIYI